MATDDILIIPYTGTLKLFDGYDISRGVACASPFTKNTMDSINNLALNNDENDEHTTSMNYVTNSEEIIQNISLSFNMQVAGWGAKGGLSTDYLSKSSLNKKSVNIQGYACHVDHSERIDSKDLKSLSLTKAALEILCDIRKKNDNDYKKFINKYGDYFVGGFQFGGSITINGILKSLNQLNKEELKTKVNFSYRTYVDSDGKTSFESSFEKNKIELNYDIKAYGWTRGMISDNTLESLFGVFRKWQDIQDEKLPKFRVILLPYRLLDDIDENFDQKLNVGKTIFYLNEQYIKIKLLDNLFESIIKEKSLGYVEHEYEDDYKNVKEFLHMFNYSSSSIEKMKKRLDKSYGIAGLSQTIKKIQENEENPKLNKILIKFIPTGQYFQVKDKKWVYLTDDKNEATIWNLNYVDTRSKKNAKIKYSKDDRFYLSYRNDTGAVKIYDAPLIWEIGKSGGNVTLYSTEHNQYMGYWEDKENELYVRGSYKESDSKFKFIPVFDY